MGLLGEVGPVAQLHEMTQMVLEGINEARQADRQANCGVWLQMCRRGILGAMMRMMKVDAVLLS